MAALIQEQVKELKKKFRALSAKAREEISVCLLKINLGVNHDKELQKVKCFIGDAAIKLSAGALDSLIEFFHSDATRMNSYNEDEVETLREEIKPKP